MKHERIGSSFESFLEEEGIRDEVEGVAQKRVLAAVRKKLTRKPEEYGEPLVRDLVGYRKLPVGQWRVVYYVEAEKGLVLVLAVGKRAEGDSENIYDQVTRADLDSRRQELRRRLAEEDRR